MRTVFRATNRLSGAWMLGAAYLLSLSMLAGAEDDHRTAVGAPEQKKPESDGDVRSSASASFYGIIQTNGKTLEFGDREAFEKARAALAAGDGELGRLLEAIREAPSAPRHPALDPRRVESAIENLGSKSEEVRKRARKELIQGGDSVRARLEEVVEKDPERGEEAKTVLKQIDKRARSRTVVPSLETPERPDSPEYGRGISVFSGCLAINGKTYHFQDREAFEKAARALRSGDPELQKHLEGAVPAGEGKARSSAFRGKLRVNGQEMEFDDPGEFRKAMEAQGLDRLELKLEGLEKSIRSLRQRTGVEDEAPEPEVPEGTSALRA